MWLSATFGMVAEELLVIKLIFPTLTNNEVGKEDSLSWNLLQKKKKKRLTEWSARTLKLTFFFYKVWMNENAKWSHLLSFTFCLKALTLGIGFSLWGDKEPVHQLRDIRTPNRPAPFEDHFSLVLMNLCLASRCWFVNSLDIYRSRKNISSFWVSLGCVFRSLQDYRLHFSLNC